MSIGALVATLMLVGVGAGPAAAEPGEDPGNSSETETSEDPGNAEEPTPAPTPTSVPRTLPDQLRDMLRRPLSVFGNGRRPGQAPSTSPGATRPTDSSTEPTKPKKRSVAPTPSPAPVEEVVDVGPAPTARSAPRSTAEVRLPFVRQFSVPVLTVPGTGARQWTFDARSPAAAYSSVEQTFATFNSLIADAYAPFDPFPDPAPPPGPAFRITQEEPVIDPIGGTLPMSGATDGSALPTLPAPMLVPRLAAPRSEPVRGVSPAPGEVLAGGSAGVPTPGLRGSVTVGGAPAERVGGAPAASQAAPMGTPSLRQGYARYLRTAPLGDIALVALPGLIGLLLVTAGGGVIGYRQANSTRYLHDDALRFLR